MDAEHYLLSMKCVFQLITDFIESNLRQRVLGNKNPVKLGRCFEFLNNWYGFKHGSLSFQGNQYY